MSSPTRRALFAVACLALGVLLPAQTKPAAKSPGRNANPAATPATAAAIDAAYSNDIKKFTTEPFFTTDLVSTLPASATVPTPQKVLGYIAGAEQHLTYSKDLYRYYDALQAASPRVKVMKMGVTEEGRDIMLVAISSEDNIAHLNDQKALAAKLADPRTLDPSIAHVRSSPDNVPANAEDVIAKDVPFYWITGSIHSSECGSPEMLMELAYRLAVDPSPMYQNIRKNWIILITPVIEVDGHDRFVDIYNWHVNHPGQPQPPLIYWGHYVEHDNNRDAMGLSLKLSQAAMQTFLDYHPVVMHDLHESEAYLYDNTLGTEPFNPWLDPIVTQEWEQIAWYNVEEMTKRGVPGVYTFGSFTTWDPSYLYFIANSHNSIGRLYETFGNGGADTEVRTLGAGDTSRTWYRPDPPLARTIWSLRDNTNYQESAILFSLDYLAKNREEYVRNFYLKSARAVAKAYAEGPAAYVFPADDTRPNLQARLINLLQEQGAEVTRAGAAFTVNAALTTTGGDTPADANGTPTRAQRAVEAPHTFPAGSFIVRMDQPYSRIVDMLLDQEYYSPADRQPYDDSGWSQGPLRNVETVRITDPKVLEVPATKIAADYLPDGGVQGSGAVYAIPYHADPQMTSLRFRLAQVPIEAAESSFEAGGVNYPAGTFLVPAAAAQELEAADKELGIEATALPAMPSVAHHTLDTPRIALVHTWEATQDEGWYRMVFDRMKIPYTYIDDHYLRDNADLKQHYDVILFPPASGNPDSILNGRTAAQPIPWKKTADMPNIGGFAETDDMRGGLDLTGIVHIRDFVKAGGLFITALDTSDLLVQMDLAPGVTAATNRNGLRARGSVLNADFADPGSPIAYGYDSGLGVYYNDGPIYSAGGGGGTRGGGGGGLAGGGGGRGGVGDRVSGRGTDLPGDGDIVQGRPDENDNSAGPAASGGRGGGGRGGAAGAAPRVILRFADANHLLYSGQLANGQVLAGHAAVIDVPNGDGHMILCAINPMWRGETEGSYALIFNAILNYSHLDLGTRAGGGAGRGARRGGGDQ